MKVKFHKYEGAGNDFIMFDGRGAKFRPDENMIAKLCDRRFGIGADGAMILQESNEGDFLMRYFNADGHEATMCGNGGRCITLFADDLGISGQLKKFMAVDGLHTSEILYRDGNKARIRLQMGDVDGIKALGNGWMLDTGSPHYVEFFENIEKVDVFNRGRELRYSADIAAYGGANINFVEIKSNGHIAVRTYERGVENETLACGTGVTASAIVTNFVKQSRNDIFDVDVRGGNLKVDFMCVNRQSYRAIHLTGPASRVFCGEFETKNFTQTSI